MFGHQLAVIFIRRHHVHLEAFLLRLFGHGADHIVRLVAGYFQNRNIVSLYDFFNDRDGLTDHFRCLFPLCLVLLEGLMAEGRSLRVKGHRYMSRVLTF